MLGTVLGIGAGLAETGYNLWANHRDFDYQKALQQQMFEREDTAVQRRMNDLQAAGLNPNLAAGSSASAGSVVSRSNTNDIHAGSALDYMAAWNQNKGLKIANEINESVREEQKAKTHIARIEYAEKLHEFAVKHNMPNVVYISGTGKPSTYIARGTEGEGESYFANNVRARIAQNDFIPQQQKIELQKLILDGQNALTQKQRLALEQNKQQIDAIYKQWQMNETSTKNLVEQFVKLTGVQVNQKELELKLDRLQWDKETFTAEMMVSLFNGIANTAKEPLGF